MYKVAQYQDTIASKDTETQKQFDMIKRLSKGFTIENATARDLDDLLSELLVLSPRPTPIIEQKTRSLSALEQSFTDLFEALKSNKGGIAIDENQVKKLVNDTIKGSKVSLSQLDTDVQKLLSHTPQIIQYSIPNTTTTAFKKPEIPLFQTIIDDVMMGNNVMLVGGAGTGKTYLAEQLIAKLALGRSYSTINCSQWTSPTEIIGGQTMDGYQEGKLIEAWKNGYVLILDELPKIDPNTAGLFNDALAKTKVPNAIIFNSRKESFAKHPDFACIATGNIYPDKESIAYGANNKQDLSLLDRFSGSVYFIEKNPSVEKAVLQNDMIWSICDKLRSIIEELKYEAQLSLRLMQNARDTYNLEITRLQNNGKDGVKANEGKTFKQVIDSFLSTFTDIQQKNIKEQLRYGDTFTEYHYRTFKKEQLIRY